MLRHISPSTYVSLSSLYPPLDHRGIHMRTYESVCTYFHTSSEKSQYTCACRSNQHRLSLFLHMCKPFLCLELSVLLVCVPMYVGRRVRACVYIYIYTCSRCMCEYIYIHICTSYSMIFVIILCYTLLYYAILHSTILY